MKTSTAEKLVYVHHNQQALDQHQDQLMLSMYECEPETAEDDEPEQGSTSGQVISCD